MMFEHLGPDSYQAGSQWTKLLMHLFVWFCFTLSCSQAAVEIPQYVGVNLLVEGAPVRRPQPLHQRQTAISNPPLTIQFHSEQKPSSSSSEEEAEASLPDKENREVGEKKTEATSASSKRVREGRTDIQIKQNASLVRRSCRSLVCEQPPQRKARRLGLGLSLGRTNRASLVPRSLSFSLSPPQSFLPQCKTGSHIPRSFFPQAAFEPQQKTTSSTRACPSLQGPLPTLEVLSLRPNIVAGTVVCHNNSGLTSHPGLRRHHLLLHAHRQKAAECKGEHKHRIASLN